ncbi:putative RNA polymerase ECF-type sigma factor [Gordonia effusa NBRC 100432]|uniref:Putative RNA polymerase ECF-type sigma factor n=1 Tax=Gordonia effusa NBRC 100432 TaxID=1077974 RepID=H0QWK7_9ACTN|nr:RNA polymerase sigma factor SigJ [Gordonia effusa]GAB17208.1 putative RNA polymerase ECF-type sigma factor [Gordonia effusa NBRC 100432]
MNRESDLADAVAVFDESRPRLFGIAYRMLGSVVEAEDIVSEAWLRWQQTDRGGIRNPPAYLTTVTTRLAINTLDSARFTRESYLGPWLPEPVDTSADPTLGAETAEALDHAVLVLLESLPSDQRAAYVLREAFAYDHEQIADVLSTTAANSRQLVSRARKHVGAQRKMPVDPAEHRSLLDAFVAAAQDGDLRRLEEVLAGDVVSISDGAGIAPRAARRPVIGIDKVARMVAGFADWWIDTTVISVNTNGAPSAVIRRGNQTLAVLTISASPSGIERLHWVMAPDKLTAL